MAMREEVLNDIFSYLHKAYDALDHYFCLYILEVYGVGYWSIRLLRRYWDQLTMVDWVKGYYSVPFKGFCGVTKGYLLSTNIFNVVADAVLQHRATVMASM